MKTILLSALALLAMIAANRADAAFIPGWDRPLYKADMAVKAATGRFEGTTGAEFVLTKQDEAGLKKIIMKAHGRETTFTVVKEEINGHAIAYLAERQSTARCDEYSRCMPANKFRVILKDQDGRWMAHVTYVDRLNMTAEEVMNLVGTPEPMVTVQ